LWATLSGLQSQTLPPLETILVDAGGNRSVEPAEGTLGAKGVPVRTLRAEDAYPGGARNAGVIAARGDWIAFIDCGMVPNERWLEELVATVGRTGDRAVLGVTEYLPTTDFQRSLCAVSTGFHPIPVLPASLFHRSVFDEVGLFRCDMRGGEDQEWLRRVRNKLGVVPIARSARTTYQDLPNDLATVVWKWKLYAEHFVRGQVRPGQQAAYLAAVPILAVLAWAAPALVPVAFLGYLVGRVVLRPIRLGAQASWLRHPRNLGRTACLAVILDVAKWGGFLLGWLNEPVRRLGPRCAGTGGR